jgi:hypothetical protein
MLSIKTRYSVWDHFEGYGHAQHTYLKYQWHYENMCETIRRESITTALWNAIQHISQTPLSSETHSITEFIFLKDDSIADSITISCDHKLLNIQQTIETALIKCVQQINKEIILE